jgi:hypothetical protein
MLYTPDRDGSSIPENKQSRETPPALFQIIPPSHLADAGCFDTSSAFPSTFTVHTGIGATAGSD